jgi:ABC-2 type transport system permease protein
MNKVITIAIADLRVYLSDRMNLISLTVMPVVLAFVIGAALGQGGGSSQIRLDVIDEDGSAASAAFLTDLQAENSALVLCGLDPANADACDFPADETLTRQAAQGRVSNGYTSALLIIPQGYGAALEAFQPVSLPYYSQADVTTGDAALTAIQAVLQRTNGAVVAARVADGVAERLGTSFFPDAAARTNFAQQTYQAATTQWQNRPAVVDYTIAGGGTNSAAAGTGFNQSVPGMATMFVLFTVLGGISLLLEERKQWTLQRLAIMPVTRAQIVGGKILARFTTGMIQFAILFVVGVVVGLDFGNDPVTLLIIAVVYVLCATALAFALAPLIRTEGQAGSLTTMLALVMSALGGAWWPLDVVPEFMRTLGHLSPVAWAMDSFNAVLYYGKGLGDVLPNLLILAVAAIVLFFFGIRNFQIE